MWSDSESDDEYYGPEADYAYKFPPRGELELRLYQNLEHDAKKRLLYHRRILDDDEVQALRAVGHRATIHQRVLQDNQDWSADWMIPRVERFFHELSGFHSGDLDLTGRFEARYERLQARWHAYARDFVALSPHVGLVPASRRDIAFDEETKRYNIITKIVNVPTVTDEPVWSAFQTKWKISPLQDYEVILGLTAETCKVIQANPTPKFQKLTLVDLPPELIENIFEHAVLNSFSDICHLAATSKYLHNAGLRLIYVSRTLSLGKRFAYLTLPRPMEEEDPSEEESAAFAAAMRHDRDLLVDQLDFLNSRPDICQRTSHLLLYNNWCNAMFPGAEHDFFAGLLDEGMFSPVLTRLDRLLPSTSLVRITVSGFPVDAGFLRGVLQQSRLVDAAFACCRLTPSAERFLAAGSNNMSLPSLRSLDLVMGNSDGQTLLWEILALCPRVTHFSAKAILREVGYHLPPIASHARLAGVLRSLKYLDLSGVGSWGLNLVLLSNLLHTAVATGPLAISHLRLAFTYGITDDVVAELLGPLHAGAAPLAVLILDGLALDGPPTAFDLIAQHFPDLDGLTITRRANERQRELKECSWPLPIYEYAARLAAFRKLRYFGANFSYSMHALRPELRDVFDAPDSEELQEWREACYSDDREAVYHQALARPFAAHCPSLEYFALPDSYYCHIERDASGLVMFHDAMMKGQGAAYMAMKAYNPGSFGSWNR